MKKYEKPNLIVTKFEEHNIITTSNIITNISNTEHITNVEWSDILNNLID